MKLDEIKDLLEAVTASGVDELEYSRGDEKIRIRRTAPAEKCAPPAPPQYIVVGGGPSSPPVAAEPQPAPGPPAETTSVPVTAEAPLEGEPEDDHLIVSAPIVGTFYESPSPDAPPFVEIGDRIAAGQVVCIIEAMKLMNEIEAEYAGVVAKRFVSNGQPVEFGEALFALKKG